ncbi:50S ribosomal protein L35 [Pseudothermotoga thermarum]|uniref:Large ribosomal subunit protein bL35 n=1 Tax=Pseudothermotoga thermarum DSM 5069 TaxID=688269 RepID=F7YWJ5_9THEM|nr:50S ribosomal protein L35 [Pseudothermotoga thermarum]AEH51976.1 LSU ribosomal protein L35P [Pseudothermotoga thermarum DSM 5069]
MAKCKMKVNKTAAKRFRVTRNGKILFNHARRRHTTGKRRRSTLRALRMKDSLKKCDEGRIKRLLGLK